jgi:ADP-ribose pyrophosphatase YjhB (NUDIX family)
MQQGRIRPIVICLFRHGERILVSKAQDATKQDYFCRPLGGGIEFGEHSQVAVLREIQEELGVAVENLKLLGVLENIFTYEGQPGHEVVFVYDAEFTDKSLYEQTELYYHELGLAGHFIAKWQSVAEIEQEHVRLVPEGLTNFLYIQARASRD